MERAFHLIISEAGRQVDGPVAEAQEELFGLFVAAIHPGIAQTGIHLMDIIKRNPCTTIGAEVTLFVGRPDTVAARNTAHIALSPLGMVAGIGIGTSLQLADEIFHPLLAGLIAHSRIDGHRREIMAAHMSVETIPVGIALRLRGQTCLLEIGSQQAVAVVLQQRLDVQVAGLFQWAVEQGDIA